MGVGGDAAPDIVDGIQDGVVDRPDGAKLDGIHSWYCSGHVMAISAFVNEKRDAGAAAELTTSS